MGISGGVDHHWFLGSQFASAFAAIVLSFGGHAVFPTIEQHMKQPKQFRKVFDMSYIILVVLYLTTALCGYLVFGGNTYSPILCNFPRGIETPVGVVTAGKVINQRHFLIFSFNCGVLDTYLLFHFI